MLVAAASLPHAVCHQLNGNSKLLQSLVHLFSMHTSLQLFMQCTALTIFFLIITATQLSAEELGNQEATMCALLFFFTSALVLFASMKQGME